MNAAAYRRVSSKAQSLAMQRHAIEQEAARRGDTIVEWFSEEDMRRGLDRLTFDQEQAQPNGRVLRRSRGTPRC